MTRYRFDEASGKCSPAGFGHGNLAFHGAGTPPIEAKELRRFRTRNGPTELTNRSDVRSSAIKFCRIALASHEAKT